MQNSAIYPIILEKSYIMAMKIETKILDNGFYYAKIRDYNRKKLVQFFIVRSNHEQNRYQLKKTSLKTNEEFSYF